MNYYISDLHFGCQNKYEGRTLNHDKLIKENWNKIVTNGDTVYILGDIGREGGNREMEYLCEIISTLKGRKVLIQGNHEKLKDVRLRQLFVEITPYKEITDNYNGLNHNLVLSHYPIAHFNGQHKGWIHLFGHLHETQENNIFINYLDEFYRKIKEERKDENIGKAYNVGAMLPYMNYIPKTLKDIIKEGDEYNEKIKGFNRASIWKTNSN